MRARQAIDPVAPRGHRRRGFSLIETLVTAIVVAVLVSFAVPKFQRAAEQSYADVASANLRAVWSAQRFYWLDNRSFSTNLTSLQSLLDPSVASATTPYTYTLTVSSGSAFTVTATRKGSPTWSGQLTIDQTGTVSGSISAAGQNPIVPGFR